MWATSTSVAQNTCLGVPDTEGLLLQNRSRLHGHLLLRRCSDFSSCLKGWAQSHPTSVASITALTFRKNACPFSVERPSVWVCWLFPMTGRGFCGTLRSQALLPAPSRCYFNHWVTGCCATISCCNDAPVPFAVNKYWEGTLKPWKYLIPHQTTNLLIFIDTCIDSQFILSSGL